LTAPNEHAAAAKLMTVFDVSFDAFGVPPRDLSLPDADPEAD